MSARSGSATEPSETASIRGIREQKRALRKELSAVDKQLRVAEEKKAMRDATRRGLECGGKQCKERVLLCYDGDYDSYKRDFVKLMYSTATSKTFIPPTEQAKGQGAAPAAPSHRK